VKQKIENSIGKIGVTKIRLIIEQSNCLFHKIETENDLGNDAFIEFIENEESKCICIASQIKSGKSYINIKTGDPFFNTDKNHLEYWNNLNLPVAGFIYDPNSDSIYWNDIKEYIAEHIGIIENGPYIIHFTDKNIFSTNTFNNFFKHFTGYYEEMASEKALRIAFNDLIVDTNHKMKYIGLKNLFTYHRNNIFSWFIMLNAINLIKDDLLRNLISIIQLIPGHGDIFWSSKNIIEEKTRVEALTILRNCWGEREVRKLLSVIPEDEGIQRGVIGQGIHAIIDYINNISVILRKIAFDRNTPEKDSFFAFLMYLNREQRFIEKEKIIDLIYAYEEEYPNSSNIESCGYLIESIQKDFGIDFYG
jgi:hypothetical protein